MRNRSWSEQNISFRKVKAMTSIITMRSNGRFLKLPLGDIPFVFFQAKLKRPSGLINITQTTLTRNEIFKRDKFEFIDGFEDNFNSETEQKFGTENQRKDRYGNKVMFRFGNCSI